MHPPPLARPDGERGHTGRRDDQRPRSPQWKWNSVIPAVVEMCCQNCIGVRGRAIGCGARRGVKGMRACFGQSRARISSNRWSPRTTGGDCASSAAMAHGPRLQPETWEPNFTSNLRAASRSKCRSAARRPLAGRGRTPSGCAQDRSSRGSMPSSAARTPTSINSSISAAATVCLSTTSGWSCRSCSSTARASASRTMRSLFTKCPTTRRTSICRPR